MDRLRRTATLVAAALTIATTLAAQTPADSVLRRQQRTLDSLTAVLRALHERVDSLLRARAAGDTAGTDELAALRAAAAAAGTDSAAANAPGGTQARLGLNALNPELTITGDVRASAYDPGPQVDNFSLAEVEIGFQSALDPYSTAKVFVGLRDGEAEVEEGYVYWSGLPGHTRLDVGRFRQTVGELNRWHAHALSEDEYPLVIRRFAGDEGLAGDGLSLYWPLPFSGAGGTYELTLQPTAGGSEVLEAGATRPAITGQLSGFWQFSRTTFGQLSVTGRYSANPDTALTTTLGVVAARFSWRPPDRATRSEFTVRGELWALRRQFDLPAPDAFDRTRLGAYVSTTWRLSRRWVAGARGDWVQSPEPGPLALEWAVTPTLTWWQSEFVYLRALFAHTRALTGETARRLTLQAVFAMGPHKHELF